MQYRKKPVVIEAIQYTGQYVPGVCNGECVADGYQITTVPHIHTLEGSLTVSLGDFIVTGVKGERYACKPDIFAMTYEAVE